MSDRWQYLLVLAACLAVTAPLEVFGRGVYRRWRRAARSILPVALIFLLWDEIAVAAHVWRYDGAYVTGLNVPVRVPIEEVLFFLVIPVCGLLTYNAVGTILAKVGRR
ncbi:lycopene cyclase, CrtYc [Mycobacterium bohemicum DSM 44277]|uniref:Lycopene cyclase n=2 Tax=Mycobacterium bohemicum TaxID=56425 RepID=A0A1X1R656_MYCBE|nr:lycopene cyclase domain-containing protein [Mycobacterium bohemicum]MCV6971017.1 lycopene cyclase domain-containing protein [Mycobacterium bohemicum]ORV00164.1 lycopene cyclase [Mycobacterium bohemicum]CPR12693.1 lycopene cyclase, CrtYc [Mycobacterium bohemicum DSM 44277]